MHYFECCIENKQTPPRKSLSEDGFMNTYRKKNLFRGDPVKRRLRRNIRVIIFIIIASIIHFLYNYYFH